MSDETKNGGPETGPKPANPSPARLRWMKRRRLIRLMSGSDFRAAATVRTTLSMRPAGAPAAGRSNAMGHLDLVRIASGRTLGSPDRRVNSL